MTIPDESATDQPRVKLPERGLKDTLKMVKLYERGLKDALRMWLRWAIAHDDHQAIDKIRKVAYVLDIELDEKTI